MSQATITTQERYATIAAVLMSNQGVTRTDGKMHIVGHLRVNNEIFAMLVNENLVVRLPQSRAEALIASGRGLSFDAGQGQAMTGWVSVGPEACDNWMSLSREALAFVGGAR